MTRNDPLIQEFIHLLDERLEEMERHLSTGKAASFEDYKRTTGVYRGIEIAKELLDEAFKTYNKDEE